MEDLEVLGLCKECCEEINTLCKMEEYPNLYECPNCGYPNLLEDLWDKGK